MRREFAGLKRHVPYQLWPDGEDQAAKPTGAIDLEAAMQRLTRLRASGQDIEPLFWALARNGFLLCPAGPSQQEELQRAREHIDRVMRLRPLELHALMVRPRPDGLLIKGPRP